MARTRITRVRPEDPRRAPGFEKVDAALADLRERIGVAAVHCRLGRLDADARVREVVERVDRLRVELVWLEESQLDDES